MRIAYNPLYKPDGKTKVGALKSAPINDIVFDLPGKSIWAKGLKFLGTDSLKIIIGSSSDTVAGTWTGQHSEIGRYEDGLTIIYIPKVAGASTTTLNINGLGAKTCYYSGNSKLTTHYPAGTPILFTYYNDGWRRADYDSNTNYYRPIEVNDTALLGNNNYVLNFKSDGNISYTTTAATSISKLADLTIGINILTLKNNLGVSTIINNASTNDLLPTSKSVYDFVGTYLTSYMHWKGNTPSSGTTFTIPSTAAIGDAYRIAVAGTIPAANSITDSAQVVEVGDIIICTDTTGPKYTVAQTNWTTLAGTSNLAWNSEVTLATIGGLEIKAKLPTNPTLALKSISFTKADGTAVSYNGSAAVDLTGGINYATLANLVKNNLIIKWGDTEGTNLFTYNGSSAKTIDLSIPFSLLFTNFSNAGSLTTRITIGGVTKDLKIDADTIDGLHANSFVRSYNSSEISGNLKGNYIGMSTSSGITSDWWHILCGAWNDEFRWNSLLALPTLNRRGLYYRSGLDNNTAFGSWVRVADADGTGASGTWGINITGNAATATNADKLDGINSTGFLRYYNSNVAPSNVDIVNTPSYVWTVSTTGGSVSTVTKPSGIDNAWGVIHLHTHSGNYATQLGFGGTTNRMYMRNAYNSSTFGNWQALAFTSDIPIVTNYYWANIPVSATSNTGTNPTFANITTANILPKTTGIYNIGSNGNEYLTGDIRVIYTRHIDSARSYTSDSNLYIQYFQKGNTLMLVNGGYVGIGTTSPAYKLDVNGVTRATNFISIVATGTQPYACTSTTLNTNLNADLLDGYHANDILPYGLENLCIGAVKSGGQTTLNSDGSITTSGNNSDTYFYVRCTEDLIAGLIYTVGFYVTGVPSGNTATWGWPFVSQNNTNLVINIKSNGWCWGTGTIPNNITAGTDIIFDDAGRGFYNSINISKFVIVKGRQKAYYTPPISKMSVNHSSTVTVNNSDANSTYRMVWHSRNTLYSTSGIYCNPSTDCLYAAHYYETSDIRNKNILNSLNITSKQLSKLPLFDFTWKDKPKDGLLSGTSALAVQKILPTLVSGEEILHLDYGVLGTIAGITACKELVTLKSEIELLKERIELLEQQLKMYHGNSK